MIFLISLSASIINAAEIYTGYSVQPDSGYYGKIEEETQSQYFQNSATQTTDSFGFGDFTRAFKVFSEFAKSIVIVPYMLKQFGMPNDIAIYLGFAVYFIYIAGIAQFIGNRGTKGMD